MVVPLLRSLESDSGLLQEVVLHDAAFDMPGRVKAHLHELSKSTRVVISNCLSIACGSIKAQMITDIALTTFAMVIGGKSLQCIL